MLYHWCQKGNSQTEQTNTLLLKHFYCRYLTQKLKGEYLFLRSNWISIHTKQYSTWMLTQVSSHALSSPSGHISQMPSVAANGSKALDTDIKSSVAGFERHASCTNHQRHISIPEGMHRVNLCLPWLQMWHLAKSLHWMRDKKRPQRGDAAISPWLVWASLPVDLFMKTLLLRFSVHPLNSKGS